MRHFKYADLCRRFEAAVEHCRKQEYKAPPPIKVVPNALDPLIMDILLRDRFQRWYPAWKNNDFEENNT